MIFVISNRDDGCTLARIDLRQLAALVAIADHGTFSGAARALYTVQSNISSRIAKLERELGVPLVDRASGDLTIDGHRVAEHARRIQRSLADIVADTTSIDSDVSGDVRIGMLGTTARWLLPHLLAETRAAYPRLRPLVGEGTTSVLIPALLAGHYHAAVLHLPVDEPQLIIEPLFAEELVVLAPPDHALAAFDSLTIADLARHPLLLSPPGSALRRVIERATRAAGVDLQIQAEVDGVRLLATLAIDGYGASIVPATAVPKSTARRFATVRVPELPPRVVALAYPRRPEPGHATKALFGVLHECLADFATDEPGVHIGTDAFPLRRSPRAAP